MIDKLWSQHSEDTKEAVNTSYLTVFEKWRFVLFIIFCQKIILILYFSLIFMKKELNRKYVDHYCAVSIVFLVLGHLKTNWKNLLLH